MRCGLSLLVLLFACGETSPAPEPIAAETSETAEASETTETTENTETAETEVAEVMPELQDGDLAAENDAENSDPTPAQDATLLATPHPEARVEIEGRINRASILRLTRALGLPTPLHVHGRPLAVPESEQVISLVSFLSSGDSGGADDQMHTEAWLLERADGSLFRVGAGRIPHQPVPSYNDIAVGGEDLATALSIKAQTIEDFDADGTMEYQLVVSLIDAVVCGVGPLTRRYLMMFNLPTMATALNVRTLESGAGEIYFRSTVLWGDQNDDAHPDIDLRVRSCTEWSEEAWECVRHGDAHVMYIWQSESDRWEHQSSVPGRVPCDGGE